MNNLGGEIVFVILHYLLENNFDESAQRLEQESKMYFNIERFTSMVLCGKWNDVDEYLRSFTIPSDNGISMMMFWLIEKQKFLEALDEHNIVKAAAVFGKDIMGWWETDTDKHLEFAKLLTMKNFREKERYAHFDVQNTRDELVSALKPLLKKNSVFDQKLDFPKIEDARLAMIIVQGCQWQQYHHPKYKELPTENNLSADHNREMWSSSTSKQQLMEGVPVTDARDNGAGPSSSPLATKDWLSLFPK